MGVAEAMDTAQRFELGWDRRARPPAPDRRARPRERLRRRRVERSSREHRERRRPRRGDPRTGRVRGRSGRPSHHPPPAVDAGQRDGRGGLRAPLHRIADGAPTEILIHWLGEAFHPGMRGYFPGEQRRQDPRPRPREDPRDQAVAARRGVRAVDARARIGPRGQVILTGDDYNFARLMEGESQESRAAPAPRRQAPRRGRSVTRCSGSWAPPSAPPRSPCSASAAATSRASAR